jgi:hypothetical protein
MPLEVTREVRLVIETDRYRHVSRPDAAQQRMSGRLDTTADNVCVGAHAELASEAADEMRYRTIEHGGRPLQADGMGDVFIQELTKLPGHRFLRRPGTLPRCREVGHDALSDHSEPAFSVEGILAGRQRPVDAGDGGSHLSIRHAGVVDRGADKLRRQEVTTQVELTLPGPPRCRGSEEGTPSR